MKKLRILFRHPKILTKSKVFWGKHLQTLAALVLINSKRMNLVPQMYVLYIYSQWLLHNSLILITDLDYYKINSFRYTKQPITQRNRWDAWPSRKAKTSNFISKSSSTTSSHHCSSSHTDSSIITTTTSITTATVNTTNTTTTTTTTNTSIIAIIAIITITASIITITIWTI